MPGSMHRAKRRREEAVIASEAKQSIVPHKDKGRMDCFVASAPRNDDDRQDFAISRRHSPESCPKFRALKSEGAGNAGCALHPRSRFCRPLQHRSSARRFFAHRRSLPCEHLRARRMTVTKRIRRRGEHGISRKTIAQGMPDCVHRIPCPTFVTIMIRPSGGPGRGGMYW
jgi:hypothetical protein